MIYVQNLAYCRYLSIWCFLFLLNFIPFSPNSSLLITLLIHLFFPCKFHSTNKRYGIVLFDIFQITSCFIKKRNLDLKINIKIFMIYLFLLKLIPISFFKLYFEYLPLNDSKYKSENYFHYFKRIWFNFFFLIR
jgi:hypothetical protein